MTWHTFKTALRNTIIGVGLLLVVLAIVLLVELMVLYYKMVIVILILSLGAAIGHFLRNL